IYPRALSQEKGTVYITTVLASACIERQEVVRAYFTYDVVICKRGNLQTVIRGRYGFEENMLH
ncbi:MAG: hypothetical protein ACK4ND_18015, partial [Cytophagaceae bacterium]